MTDAPALELIGLTVGYRRRGRWQAVVRDVSLKVAPGEACGLVGESGSGKSTLALAVMRVLPPNGRILGGAVRLAGRDMAALEGTALRRAWRDAVGFVPQDSRAALNPTLPVGDQLAETLPARLGRRERARRVASMLEAVRLADPERVAAGYPHELSGGMQQRVMIAMALARQPALLVLDEPTTALDVTTEAVILDLVRDLVRGRDTAVLYVTHNLGVVSGLCDRVAVMYAGELVEDAPARDLFRAPLNPYSRALLASVPRLGQDRRGAPLRPIPGEVPAPGERLPGCAFAPRCPLAIDDCATERPAIEAAGPGHRVRCLRWADVAAGQEGAPYAALEAPADTPPDTAGQDVSADSSAALSVERLTKCFPVPRTLSDLARRRPARAVRAVDDVDLDLEPGRTLGLVGESGSGKTTLARCVTGLEEPTSGAVRLAGAPLPPGLRGRDLDTARRLQMVFQHPEQALNPHRTVGQALRRPLGRLAGVPADRLGEAVGRLLEAVSLPASYAERRPAELSGGEKQRVAIARAFASRPTVVLLDEAVSSLDVSVQAAVLELLDRLQRAHGSAYLFVSHDLAAVSYVADEVAVMYLGRLVEHGRTADVLAAPHHPYTEALVSAVPTVDPDPRGPAIRLSGDVPSAADAPTGCPFHTRCPRVLGPVCTDEAPPWQTDGDHVLACHIPLAELRALQAAGPPPVTGGR